MYMYIYIGVQITQIYFRKQNVNNYDDKNCNNYNDNDKKLNKTLTMSEMSSTSIGIMVCISNHFRVKE